MTTESHIVPQWSEAEMDQIQDFLGTVHGWKAGRVLSQGDIDDILLYLRYEDTEGEAAVDAYHEGVAKGCRDTLSPDDVATMERLEKLSGDLCVERAYVIEASAHFDLFRLHGVDVPAHSQARVNDMRARLAAKGAA